MKAVAVFPEKGKVRVIEVESPRIETPTQVKLRMVEVGICGTDREISTFLYGSPPPGSESLIIGHESLGEVVEVGAAVCRVDPGDLVVVTVRRPCPHAGCMACRSGRQDFCYTGDFTERGIKGAHGFMTEFVVDDEVYVNLVPRELRDVAVLVEPLTIAEKAIIQLWQVQQRLPWACPIVPGKEPGYCHKAVVLGAGPIGLLGAMAFLINGFETYLYSLEPPTAPQAAFARLIGATYIWSMADSPQRLAERVGNIDLVYEATGAAQVSFEVMKVLGTNGIFIFTGVPGRKGPIELDADQIMRGLVLKNQVIFGTVNAGRDAYEAAIHDLALFKRRWPNAVQSLINGRYPIEAASDILLGKPKGIKSVIAFDWKK